MIKSGLNPGEEEFRIAFDRRVNAEIVALLRDAPGKNIRFEAAQVIVCTSLISLASIFAARAGMTEDQIIALAKDCWNETMEKLRESRGDLN